MGESMWLKCCQCGKQFEIFGELADQTRAFYVAQPSHTPDKAAGVCEECWANRTDKSVAPASKRRWFQVQFGLLDLFLAMTAIAIPLIARAYGSSEMALSLFFAPAWLPILLIVREILLKKMPVVAALSLLIVIELAALPISYFVMAMVTLRF